MKRILIIGCPGAGKSTFARKLSEITGLPLVHLDRLYWRGDWDHTSREEFDKLLEEELRKDSWIIDGNFNRTIPHRLNYADQVFYLDMPTALCLWGITKRVIEHHGKTRDDMGGNCPEYFDSHKPELYKSVLTFRRDHRGHYYKLLESSGVPVTIFRRRKHIKKYLQSIHK